MVSNEMAFACQLQHITNFMILGKLGGYSELFPPPLGCEGGDQSQPMGLCIKSLQVQITERAQLCGTVT